MQSIAEIDEVALYLQSFGSTCSLEDMLILHPQVKAKLSLESFIHTGSCEIEIPVEDGSISCNGIEVKMIKAKLEKVTGGNGLHLTGKITRVFLDANSYLARFHRAAVSNHQKA